MAEDWFRSIHLLTASEKIVYINDPLYNYRTNDASISRSFRPETISGKNIVYAYNHFVEYLPEWGLNDTEHIQKLNARWLDETIYTFTQYYENVNRKDRKAVLEFDWSSMMPNDSKNNIDNPYENKTSRKLYNNIINKKFMRIKLYFAIIHLYKNYRQAKMNLRLLFKS